MILEIEVCFPAGRFHGEEWPPAPARLFQALVAATHLGAHGLKNRDRRDAALHWLETLPPPVIAASQAVLGCAHLDNYVPNNDDSPGPNAHIRTAKTLAAYAFPVGGAVAYRWTFDGTSGVSTNCAADVAAMAFLVTHLGRTIDGVFARGRVAEESSLEESISNERNIYLPREVPGGRWRAPAEGFFALLCRRYPRSVSSEPPDFTNSRQVEYVSSDSQTGVDSAAVPMAFFELLRLDGERSLRFDARDVRQPAGMVRGALLEWAKQRPFVQRAFGADMIARLLAGHCTANYLAPSKSNGHFGIAPLPSLNDAATADGELRRIALIGWGDGTATELELFEEAVRGLHGARLHDNGQPCGILSRSSASVAAHWRDFWSRPARTWRSVTPIVLPGRMRAGRKVETLVARALEQAGYKSDEIASIAIFSGPVVPHTRPAREYRISRDDYLSTSPRHHVEICFRRLVTGPLVIGRGRFAGLGLCLPLPEMASAK